MLFNCGVGKTLESPLDGKEIQPVRPKRNQSWIFVGRTDAEAETPILWPPDFKELTDWKRPNAGNDWRQEKGTTEDEMAGWHLNGHGFGWTLGVGDGQGSLTCCSPWGRKKPDTTEQLNWIEIVLHQNEKLLLCDSPCEGNEGIIYRLKENTCKPN